MSVAIIGNGGVVADVDEARNVQMFQGIAGYPAAGGFFSVTGQAATTGTPATPLAVAAALAANTMLMSARLSPASVRKAYVTKFRVVIIPITGAAAAVVPGSLAIQRFIAQTPTGGNARTAARLGETKGSITDITDIRDSNAALTGTAPTFGTVLGSFLIPVVIGAVAAGYTQQAGIEYIYEPATPVELAAGDGLALRTQTTCPATATWTYSYTLHWFER
jgi:hypothetical protein